MITIDGYVIDGAASEEEALEAEATEYPVESGATITDHVTNSPVTLALEFVVSDTPIGAAAASRAAGVVPSSEARQVLTALRDSRRPFTVVTGVRSYESMVFTSLSFPRDGKTGAALRGTASLKRIELVDVRRVSVTMAARKHLGQRATRHVAGKKIWLCPSGTPVVERDATNLAHGCRQVIDAGLAGGLVFADNLDPLSDADKQRLVAQTAVAAFNPIGQFWTNPRTATPVSKFPTFETTFGSVDEVPSDYEPPVRQGVTPQSLDAYYGDPFSRLGG